MKNLNMMIGELLKERILAKGYNYSTFAERVGFKQSYISKIINGDVKRLPIETLERLVEPLEMSVVGFLQEVEKKK